jgi:3-dehydroquinate synthase
MIVHSNYIQAAEHDIYFGQTGFAALESLLKENRYSKVFIFVDTLSHENCLQYFLENLATDITIEIVEFEHGEENKNIETCLELWKVLTELGADRKSVVINLGGGVVTDLGSFVASTFKRGIDFIEVPTTLLAMVDAAIGGKNGVDLGSLKNQVGIIRNSKLILIDSTFLKTLPQNQMLSGLAEMLKHGLIYDKLYWKKFSDISVLDSITFDQLIYDSVVIKNEIVLQDPTENGLRKALNFGHTLGHAIESYFLENENKQKLLHGEAIAVGIIVESFIAWQKKLLSTEEYFEIKSIINSIYKKIEILNDDYQPILDLLIHDKKNEYGKVQFVLLNGIGAVKINQNVNKDLIIKSLDDYKT